MWLRNLSLTKPIWNSSKSTIHISISCPFVSLFTITLPKCKKVRRGGRSKNKFLQCWFSRLFQSFLFATLLAKIQPIPIKRNYYHFGTSYHSEPEMRLGELEMNLGNDHYSNVIPQWVNQMALKREIFT